MTRALRFDAAGSLNKPRRTSQGYLRVDGWASRTGILEYRNPDGSVRRELREPDAVFAQDSLLGFEGAPITDDHPSTMVDLHNAKTLTKGTVLSVGRRDGDHVAVSLVITDPDLIRKIESGKRQLSTGYYVELDETPGVHPQFGRYDARQVRVGPVNHLAVVDRGRAGTASLRMDAADDGVCALVEISLEPRLDDIERRIAALRARRDAEWNESDHPRDESGKFTDGGGGGGGGAPSKRPTVPSAAVAEIHQRVKSNFKEMGEHSVAVGGKDPHARFKAVQEKYGMKDALVWRALGGSDLDDPDDEHDRPDSGQRAKSEPEGPAKPYEFLGIDNPRDRIEPSKPSSGELNDDEKKFVDAMNRHPSDKAVREAMGVPHTIEGQNKLLALSSSVRQKLGVGNNETIREAAKRQGLGDKAPKTKRPTYVQAQTKTFEVLKNKGWTVKSDLKVPHATSPDGSVRLWFKSQAVWKSEGSQHSLKGASSTFDDLRDFGHSDEGVLAFAERHTKRK